MSESSVRSKIRSLFVSELKRRTDTEVTTPHDDMVLLESGLDSIGFATLVARLEEELGYDPFTEMDDPVYPQTFGEFVEIYEQYSDLQS